MIWYAGVVKGFYYYIGSVAFALCIYIKTPNKDLIVSSTTVIVLLTMFLMTGFL